jgi:hypothetical protein
MQNLLRIEKMRNICEYKNFISAVGFCKVHFVIGNLQQAI